MKKQKKIGEFNPGEFKMDFNADFQIEEPLPPGTPFDDLPYTGDLEEDTKMELNEYQKENRQQKRQYQAVMDGVFDSAAQRHEFAVWHDGGKLEFVRQVFVFRITEKVGQIK